MSEKVKAIEASIEQAKRDQERARREKNIVAAESIDFVLATLAEQLKAAKREARG